MSPNDINILEALEQRLFKLPLYLKRKIVKITLVDINALTRSSIMSFKKQTALLDIDGPVHICGDIHGQFQDLLEIFNVIGRPPSQRYVFLGDYVDRGRNSLEVIFLLLTLKTLYPNSVYLIRGNHEFKDINKRHGFLNEIEKRFNHNHAKIYNKINNIFDYMPLAAIVSAKIFCCHGGLGPELVHVEQIKNLKLPLKSLSKSPYWVTDLLWSDPSDRIQEYELMNRPIKEHRGAGHLFGRNATQEFLKRNGLEKICRAHECVPKGVRWQFEKQLCTIFSAKDYCNNPGVIMFVSAKGVVRTKRF